MPSKRSPLVGPRRRRDWASPLLFGLVSWLGFPAVSGHADLAGLLAGLDGRGENWRMVLTASPAGSIHSAELAFGSDDKVAPLPADSGLTLPDGRKIAFAEQQKPPVDTPDESRVTRDQKRGRVLAVVPMLPPKTFTAGSIMQRTSMLFPADKPAEDQTGFVKAKRANVEIASFYFRKEKPKVEHGVPTLLADLVTNPHADVLATAYAPAKPDFSRASPFAAIMTKPDEGRFVPPITTKDHAWAANVLPPEVFSPEEQQCLSSGIYFEARGESVKGQAAVAQVILNRVRNPAYPGTICGVVYQNKDWRNRCQFSFACDNIRDRVNSKEHWKIAHEVALAVTAGKIWLKEVGSATHYHAVYVRPRWARSMEKVGRIGLHVFYRTENGGWG